MTENEEREEVHPEKLGEAEVLEPEPGFGEQEEVAQEKEWAEDAAEGGDPDAPAAA